MRVLSVRHLTTYRYKEPVELGEHRMMFRPRESHDLRLIRTRLDITPQPTELRWLHDVFDNSVAVATFSGATTLLQFDSMITLEHVETKLPDYVLEFRGAALPIRLSARRRTRSRAGAVPARSMRGDRSLGHRFPAPRPCARQRRRHPGVPPSHRQS